MPEPAASTPATSASAPTLAVIGGGQLARMMAQPAIALGLPLRLLAEAPGVSAAQVVVDHQVGDHRDLETLRRVRASGGPRRSLVKSRMSSRAYFGSSVTAGTPGLHG